MVGLGGGSDGDAEEPTRSDILPALATSPASLLG